MNKKLMDNYIYIPYFLFILTIIFLNFSLLINSGVDKISEILFTSIFSGFVEELLFRKFLQNKIKVWLKSKNKMGEYSVLIVSIVFGIIHIVNIFQGKQLSETLVQCISATAGGLILGSLYYKYKNFFLVAIIHSIYDISAFSSQLSDNVMNSDIIFTIMYVSMFFITGIYAYIQLFSNNDKENNNKLTTLLYCILQFFLLSVILLYILKSM